MSAINSTLAVKAGDVDERVVSMRSVMVNDADAATTAAVLGGGVLDKEKWPASQSDRDRRITHLTKFATWALPEPCRALFSVLEVEVRRERRG